MSSSSRFPSGNLKSSSVRAVLTQHIVSPLLQSQYTIAAVRLSWFNHSAEYLDRVSEQLVGLRAQLDDHVKQLDGLHMFISAVTATRSGFKKDQQSSGMLIYPGVSYWTVFDSAAFNQRDFCNYLQATQLGTTMKLLLQPYQQGEKDLKNALFSVLKDTQEGVVRRLVDMSAQVNLKQAAGTYNITRAYIATSSPAEVRDVMTVARNQLASVNFPVDLI